MPLKGFICPDGEGITVDDCLKEGGCRRGDRCASRTYLHMASSERPWTGTPSTTQLINGTMLAYQRIVQEYSLTPDSRAFRLHGTMVHAKLTTDDELSLIEEKLDGAGTEVTGIFDIYEEENGVRKLIDTKSSGSYKVMKALGYYQESVPSGGEYKSGPRKGQPRTKKVQRQSDEYVDRWEWELQLNMYRIQLERLGFPVDRLQIQCIPRDGGTYIAKSRGVVRNVYLFDINFLPDEQVLEYFKRKRRALLYALRYGWTKPCTGKENWDGIRCARFCEVAQFCPLGKYLLEEKERLLMPIEGLSDAVRLQIMGKMRLGRLVPNKSGTGEHPEELRWFRIDPTAIQDENLKQEYIEMFHAKYGPEPTMLNIIFPSDDREVIFPQYYTAYGSGSGMKCQGDGKTAECFSEDMLKNLDMTGKNGPRGKPIVTCKGSGTKGDEANTCCPYFKNEAKPKNPCSIMARLRYYVPDLPGTGMWETVTGSINAIINVNSALTHLEQAMGRFSWLPLQLMRVPKDITHDGHKRTHYPLAINMNVSLLDLMKYSKMEPIEILEANVSDEHSDLQDMLVPHSEVPALPAPEVELPEKVEESDQAIKNFAELCHHIGEAWQEESEVIRGFLVAKLDTEEKAYQVVMMNLSDDNWMTDMKNLFNQWIVKEKIDNEEEPEEPAEEKQEPEEEKEEPEPTPPKVEFTYDSMIASLVETLGVEKKQMVAYIEESYNTKGKATLALKNALRNGASLEAFEAGYTKWERKQVESPDDESPEIPLEDVEPAEDDIPM